MGPRYYILGLTPGAGWYVYSWQKNKRVALKDFRDCNAQVVRLIDIKKGLIMEARY